MPTRYDRDDAHRRVVIAIQGAFELEEVLAIMARQRVDGTWTYGLMYDLRAMTGRPTTTDLRQMMTQAALPDACGLHRGPVALLATESTLYGKLCAYAALSRSTVVIEVFRDVSEAMQWLTAAAPP